MTFLQVDRSGDSLFFPSEQSLGYLDGTHAGDFGFDPLGLSDPEGAGGFIDPDWLRYAEIINGRWAMLGAAGCLGPEALGAMGVIPEATRVVWFKSGVYPPAGTPEGLYGMDPWALFWVEVVLMQFAELRRWQDYKNPGSMGEQYFLGLENFLKGSGEPAYPGTPPTRLPALSVSLFPPRPNAPVIPSTLQPVAMRMLASGSTHQDLLGVCGCALMRGRDAPAAI